MQHRGFKATGIGKSFRVICTVALLSQGNINIAKAQGEDKLIASVNGESIMQSEFHARLQRMRAQDFVASVSPLTFRAETAGAVLLSSLINERLIVQWAIKTKQMPTEEEVKIALESIKQNPQMLEALKNGLILEPDLKREIMVERARFNLATTAVSISPAEVEKFYKDNIASYSTPDKWDLALLRTGKAADLPKIQAQLKANKPFDKVVAEFSEDEQTRGEGGKLATINSNDQGLPAPIREAVKTLKPGGVTPAIKLEYTVAVGKPKIARWWFVKLVKREAGVSRPFAEIKDQVERTALLQRSGGYAPADKKIGEFRKEADIKIMLAQYEGLKNVPVKK